MARAPRQKVAEQTEGLARRIWLAGLGAYGQSLEDAQHQLDRAGGEASRLFQELVAKGQLIEEQSRGGIRNRIDEARSAISGRVATNTRSVEDMIRRVRDKVGLDTALSGRLDALARRVDGLAQTLGFPPASPAPAARKGSSAKTKPASRKAVAPRSRTEATKKKAAAKPAAATRKPAAAKRKPAAPKTRAAKS